MKQGSKIILGERGAKIGFMNGGTSYLNLSINLSYGSKRKNQNIKLKKIKDLVESLFKTKLQSRLTLSHSLSAKALRKKKKDLLEEAREEKVKDK